MANSTKQQPGAPPPQPSPLKSTLGALALAFGVVAFGAYVLDFHAHSCQRCGNRWRHFGAFHLGDERAHQCGKCGASQWVKDGWQKALGVQVDAPEALVPDGGPQPTSDGPQLTSDGLRPTPGAVLPQLPSQLAQRAHVPPSPLATLRRPAVMTRTPLPSLAGLLEEQRRG